MTNWRTELTRQFKLNGETWADVVANTLTEAELDIEFDSGYGIAEGVPFTLWTKNYVYFPVQYDGAEMACAVPRNPNGQPTPHFGGG